MTHSQTIFESAIVSTDIYRTGYFPAFLPFPRLPETLPRVFDMATGFDVVWDDFRVGTCMLVSCGMGAMELDV